MNNKMTIYKGDDTDLYGVVGVRGGILYEAEFTKAVARRIAQLENSPKPPRDWEETRNILQKEGFDV